MQTEREDNEPGILIYPTPGEGIKLAGPVTDANNQPQAPDAVTLTDRDTPPANPGNGRRVIWATSDDGVRMIGPTGAATFTIWGPSFANVSVSDDEASLNSDTGARVAAKVDEAFLVGQNATINAGPVGIELRPLNGVCVIINIPTVMPELPNRLWVDPVTRVLMLTPPA